MYARPGRGDLKSRRDASKFDEHGQGRGMYPAPPRPQPFNSPASSFTPYDPHTANQTQQPQQPSSPSTAVNLGGNGLVDANGNSNGFNIPSNNYSNSYATHTQNGSSGNNTNNNPTFSSAIPTPPIVNSTNPSFTGTISSSSASVSASQRVEINSNHDNQQQEQSFYNLQSNAYQQNFDQFQQQPQHANNSHMHGSQSIPQPLQPLPSQQQQQQQQQYLMNNNMLSNQQQQQQPSAANSFQAAVPFMMAGFQQMTGASAAANGGQVNHAALGAQILQTLAPGAAGYTNQIFGGEPSPGMKSNTFMRIPKYYFAVNHRYVLRKLSLILMPFMNRTWSRQRGLDNNNNNTNDPSSSSSDNNGLIYLPPREDVNAPDLYIPVMSFVTYVLVVGFVFGTRNAFKAEVLANYFSRGLGVLTMEVLVIKLLLYLINARPTPWLDVIAYRGYKFVGVVLTIILGLVVPKLYLPSLIYSATAMGIFLMRSHRRIILPRDMEMHESQDLARRNAFLLFVCVLQYPIYWILARVLYIKTA